MKAAIQAAWREELRRRRGQAEQSQNDARAGTRVDGDHRPENRGERAAVTTQGYLAAGFAQRIAELDEALRLLELVGLEQRETVAVGALVELSDGRRIAVLPGGDATRLSVEGLEVLVLSAQAPLVRALAEAFEEDEVALVGGREVEVVELS